ncbi:TPA: restriction endonuclease subunit S [Staphylococcus aureus]|nr:restriction endonuclease subunit S [Staphylococcus aureus]HDE0395352.1 restriction endonuclease subunit S [Staphylococcus aureus]HDG5652402.1 restriction endonuclease subunit S [Staphylococcus aureus]HDH5896442.1 restriction endonuclease subunit S [Staphylococcus aureus]
MSNTQKKNLPELRFPGFEGEWEEKKLGEFCEFNNGINAKKEQYGMGRKFINVLDILNNNFITYESIIGKVSVPENVEKNNKVEFGDLVFLRSSETREDVGLCNVYLDKNYALYGGFIIRGKKVSDYNPIFLKEALNIPKKRYEIGSAAGGSTRFNVSQDILRKINVKFPSIKEQQKIGDLFSKLDRQIELEEQKLELLKQQKKGYMQKIFSQELRFKDENGNDYPEWESKSIQEIFENKGGTALETEFNFDGNYKVISIGSYSINSTYNDQNIRVNKNKKTEKYILSKGDLAMVLNDKTKDGKIIGRSIFIDKDNQYIYNQRTERLIPFAENDNKFLWFLMNTDLIRNKIKGMMQGATQVYINYSSIKLISIQLPLLEEQQKIRGFLEVLSGITTEQLHKIDQLKERKKAFLQKMFI